MTRSLEARLTWQAADPTGLAGDLGRRLGTRMIPGLELVPWRRETPSDEPAVAGRLVFEPVEGPPDGPRPDAAGLHLVAVAWATVELDRAATELEPWLAPGSGDEADEPHLGARVRVRRTAGLPGDHLVLAEPVTEGRLAASLARDGEGPCALYLRPAAGLDAWIEAALARGLALSGSAAGPFGRSVLLPGAPAAGPHVIVIEAPEPSLPPAGDGYHPTMNDAATVNFRDATADDAARLASLLSDEGYPAGATDLEGRLVRFARPDRVIVAEAGGEVLGFIAFAFIPRFENNGQFMRVIAIVVDPGVRERGIGRMLFAEAERIAAEEGAAFFEITAGHHRPEARHLYESLGYEAGVTTYLRKRP